MLKFAMIGEITGQSLRAFVKRKKADMSTTGQSLGNFVNIK